MKKLHIGLVVGQSNSGKTTLISSIISDNSFPKVYYINDKSRENSITFKDVEALRECCLIIEDLYNCTREQLVVLQHLLNYKAHHDNVNPIFIVCHSIQKTKIHNLLPLVTHVYLTGVRSNIGSLKSILLYYNFPLDVKHQFFRLLLNNKKPFRHFCLDLQKGIMEPDVSPTFDNKTDKDSTKIEESGLSVRKNQFLSFMPDPHRAEILFDLIISKLSDHYVDSESMCMRFSHKKKIFEVNIFDYILFVTSEKKMNEKQINHFKNVHKCLSRYVKIPYCLVLSPYL